MKATELMIGDWVMLIDDDTGNDYKKAIVEHIDKRGRIGLRTETGSLAAWNIEHIKPIPLTHEILEKNGFKRFCTSYILREYLFELTNPSTPDNYLDNYWLNVCGRSRNIKYVHQLQHALRLCGIDKEIVL